MCVQVCMCVCDVCACMRMMCLCVMCVCVCAIPDSNAEEEYMLLSKVSDLNT